MKKQIALALALLICSANFSFAQAPTPLCIKDPANQSCVTELAPAFSSAAESGHLFRSKEGVTSGFQVNNLSTSTGLNVFALDASSIPVNGTLATCTGLFNQITPCIMKNYGIGVALSSSQASTLGVSWGSGPNLHYFNGFVLVCSSTNPPTLTLSSNCTFSAEIQ